MRQDGDAARWVSKVESPQEAWRAQGRKGEKKSMSQEGGKGCNALAQGAWA